MPLTATVPVKCYSSAPQHSATSTGCMPCMHAEPCHQQSGPLRHRTSTHPCTGISRALACLQVAQQCYRKALQLSTGACDAPAVQQRWEALVARLGGQERVVPLPSGQDLALG